MIAVLGVSFILAVNVGCPPTAVVWIFLLPWMWTGAYLGQLKPEISTKNEIDSLVNNTIYNFFKSNNAARADEVDQSLSTRFNRFVDSIDSKTLSLC